MALVTKLPALSKSSAKVFEDALGQSKSAAGKNQLFPKCSERTGQRVNYSIDDSLSKPYINMKQLDWLVNLDKTCADKNEAHEQFMNNYHMMFHKEHVDPNKTTHKMTKIKSTKMSENEDWKRSNEPLAITQSGERSQTTVATSSQKDGGTNLNSNNEHNIRVHLEKIHSKSSHVETEEELKAKTLRKLKKLVKKFPFERTDEENSEIFKILTTFDDFMALFSPELQNNKNFLKQFCGYAQLETVSTKSTPVFGNFAFYVLLKGSVKPLSVPHINSNTTKLRSCTPEPDDPSAALPAGSCFGTITDLSGRELTTRMFRVITLEEKCEFLKLSIESFKKISKKISEEEQIAKFTAIKSCASYTSWPKHTLEELMRLFEWRHFDENTILTSEGYRCPFIGFLSAGECHVLRKVDVPHYNKKTNAREKRIKQVVVGKLRQHESFGEISVTMKEPMTCSIVTETPCQIGIIPCEKIADLDNITLRLLLQTSNRTFSDLGQDEIHRKFIEQEKKKEWKSFKSEVVHDVIGKYGIVQGNGKYKTSGFENEG